MDKLILSSDVKNYCEQIRYYPRKQGQHSGFKVGKFLLNSRPFQEGTDWRSERMWWELWFEGFKRQMRHSLVNKGGDLRWPFA